MILRALIACLLFASLPWIARAQPSGVKANAPILNFTLPTFNDDGARTSLLRGNEARYVNDTQIEVVAMQYIVFRQSDPSQADVTLIAPSATALLGEGKRYAVRGHEGVRIVRDDIDIGGTNWLYETDETKSRRITLETNVRVVFRNMTIGNILK